MNKQSNAYTVIYIVVLVLVVGTALAFTSLGLKDRQQQNVDADKMRQILAAALITPKKDQVVKDFNRYVKAQTVVDMAGKEVPGLKAFDVNVALESKKSARDRELPVYEVETPQGAMKYVIPVYGAGLWGPIWGYLSFNDDGTTIYGAYFAHQGETPGLGAEIEKPAFCDQFQGKAVFKGGRFMPIAVVKNGLKPQNGEDYVDGISGGTITSKGVASMIDNCLSPYKAFLQKVSRSATPSPLP